MAFGLLDEQGLRVFLGAILLLSAVAFARGKRRQPVERVHLRGRSMRTSREAALTFAKALPLGDTSLQFGRQALPSSAAGTHFAIVGATGSGKTILQRLLMQSALPLVGRNLGHRALVYDAKQDAVSMLAGMKLTCPVYLLNALDSRSVAWDMAADVTCPASALQVASLLIPEAKSDSNPFFTNAARHLLYGTALALIHLGQPWTLRDLILRSRDGPRLRELLANCPHTEFLLQYFEHTGTFQNILSTLLTHLCPFEVIAAAWDGRQAVSLTQWMREEAVLVLGSDEPHRAAMDALNRLIFRRLTELVLGSEELRPGDTRRTWFFLDEVREAGRLDGLSRLLTKGRSKGAAVVLGFQDIAGLHDVYGPEVAEELVGQCANKAILRLNSPKTAAWASSLLGTREVIERQAGNSKSTPQSLSTASSRSESVSHSVAARPLVLDSEFLGLPETNPANGLSGYFITPASGPFCDHLPGETIAAQLLPPDRSVPNFVPLPVNRQYLRPWTETEPISARPHFEPKTGTMSHEEKITHERPKRETTPHALNCVRKKEGT